MSAGIARTFRTLYGRTNFLKQQNPSVGAIVSQYANGRHSFYLVTKRYLKLIHDIIPTQIVKVVP